MLAASAQQTSDCWSAVLADFALAHVAIVGGATLSELQRDLLAVTSHRLSPSEFRQQLAAGIALLQQQRLVKENRGRFAATQLGAETAQTRLGWRSMPEAWPDLRDTYLTAQALGMSDAPHTRIRMLRRPDGLRAAILQTHFGLRMRRVPTAARVRAELAGYALKQAFGNKLPDEVRPRGAFDAKSSRLLAAQLSRRPRDFGSDARLVAALAAEVMETPQTDVASLRLAVFRRYVNGRLEPLNVKQAANAKISTAHAAIPSRKVREAPERPDVAQFAAAVLASAEACAAGGGSPGRRKVFICEVWDEIQKRYPRWHLNEVEFKGMLTEAHRTGHLSLANADLKSKDRAGAFQRSAVNFRNTVWHFVRLAPANLADATHDHAVPVAAAPGNEES